MRLTDVQGAVPPRRVKATGVDFIQSKIQHQPAPIYRGEGSDFAQAVLWFSGRVFLRAITVLFGRLRVRGRHNVPTAGAALLVTNHQSFMDPWLIGLALRRQLHYMARDSLFKGGFGQYMLERTNAFPVRRGTADLQALRTAIERLKKGFLVNLFPESTRTLDGTIGPIAAGVAIIIHRARVPVIPTLIDGAYECWPRSRRFPRPGLIRICYGQPIPYSELADLDKDAVAVRLREALVRLQETTGSPHAAASRKRMEMDLAAGVKRLAGAETN